MTIYQHWQISDLHENLKMQIKNKSNVVLIFI